MQPNVWYVPKLSDRDLIKVFEASAKSMEDIGARVAFQDGIGELSSDEVGSVKKANGLHLTYASIQVTGAQIRWSRLVASANDRTGLTHDKVELHNTSQQASRARSTLIQLSSVVSRQFDRAAGGLLRQDDEGSPPSHSQVLASLERVAADVIDKTNEQRAALDRAYSEEREKLEARVEADRKKLHREIDSREEALKAESERLKRERQELDDRDNTTARRAIQKGLQDGVEARLENFAISAETRRNYWALRLVFLALIAIAVTAAIVYSLMGLEIAETATPQFYIANAKAVLMVALAVGAYVSLLKVMNGWFRRVADTEFTLQQFKLDTLRASWLAETVLEWSAATDAPFPDILASRFSEGLFGKSAADESAVKSPVEQLSEALIGGASKVKLVINGQEVELDRKALKLLETSKGGEG